MRSPMSTEGRPMPMFNAAQNKAAELFQNRGKRALEVYLEQWRDGVFRVTAEYVLSVVHEYELLRKCETIPTLKLGDLTMMYATQRAFWKDVDVNLTVAEFKVTKRLLDTVGEFVTYRAIYDTVHYVGFRAGLGNEGYCANVRSMIKRVRHKFLKIDPTFDQIENYSSFGYRWLRPGISVAEVIASVGEMASAG
jgi:DNA-binding response OmpR family regulator